MASATGPPPPVIIRDGTRVLIVMLTALGDAVHVLPVVHALKRAAPGCHITWVAQGATAALLRGHPAIDEFLVFDRRRGLAAFGAIARALRGRRFDLLLDLQTSFKAGVITGLSGVPVRIGFDWARTTDLNGLFTTHRIPARGNRHVQDQFFEFLEYLDVEPRLPVWNLGPWPSERAQQATFFSAFTRPVVTLILATSNPEKDWIPERWAELVDVLVDEFGLAPVLAGGTSAREREVEQVIHERAHHRPVSTLGVPLRELVWTLDGSALVISPDTGPLHMAVALRRPVISLMGYKDPRRVGPYDRSHELVIDAYSETGEVRPVSRAHRPGRMKRIQVADVVDKVRTWRDATTVRPASPSGTAGRYTS